MKKEWNRPRALVQHFIANEYIASSCGTTQTKYKFICDVPSGYLYEETNGKDGLQRYGGPGYTADKLLYRNTVQGCNLSHEASTLDDFPRGYSYSYGQVTNVLLWYEHVGHGTGDWHATTNTNKESWEVVKS